MLQKLHMLLLNGGDELAGFRRVVEVPDLHRVEGKGGLEQPDRRLTTDGGSHSA